MSLESFPQCVYVHCPYAIFYLVSALVQILYSFRIQATAWYPHHCRIIMLYKVLLIHYLMKCSIWTVVLYRAHLNDVRSFPSQSAM